MELDPSLIDVAEDGSTLAVLSNPTGCSVHLDEGSLVGSAVPVETVEAPSDKLQDEQTPTGVQVLPTGPSEVLRVQAKSDEWREAKLEELVGPTHALSPVQRQELINFLRKHHAVFSLEENERGETDLVKFTIDTGDAKPQQCRPRRMPFAVRSEVARQLKVMQESHVIQPSTSPWASPVVLVRKKDGSHRFCIDYRRLNAVTKSDIYPLPRIDDLLDQLGRCKYFSTLDLASGYWQIRVAPESREKTAFVTPQGHYEFLVMPFGLTNAPAVFQRLMQKLLSGLNPEAGPDFVAVYIDDVLVFSQTIEEHLNHLQTVIERIEGAGLMLKPTKCRFARQEVEYLGHVVTPEGLKPDRKLVEAITEFSAPTDVNGVRRFLGLASYYRRFIGGFARIAAPLRELTRKNALFKWTGQCEEAMRTLKVKLTSAPVLVYPTFDKPFTVETDASINGLGAVLQQSQDDGQLHPVAYASRSLTAAERNYSITEMEVLAVVWALTKFHPYIYGQSVTVITDHAAVRAVLETPNPSAKHARWWTRVYGTGLKDIRILYRPGRLNVAADALSRSPHLEPPLAGEGEHEAQVSMVQLKPTTAPAGAGTIENVLNWPPHATKGLSFAEEQRKDPDIVAVITFLETGELPQDGRQARRIALQKSLFAMEDGLLFYVDPRQEHRLRVVVPDHLQEQILLENHSGITGGHFSSKKTYAALTRHWWWDGMYHDTVQFVSKCPQCAIVTGGSREHRPPLHPIPVSRPFQIIGVDIMELPTTEQGNRYVLVFQDFLTKWPMVYPMPDQKSIRIVELLVNEVIPQFGVPESLLSDRGTNLLSHLMTDVCRLLGIKKLNTTSHHPQCNGMVERFNRMLKTMLRKYAAEFGTQWDRYLSGALWAYRNVPHDSTGEKPSFLLYGVDCRTPTEAALLPNHVMEPMEISDYREELVLSLSTARRLAAEAIQTAQVKYKTVYDRHSCDRNYQVGDWVLVRFPQDETGRMRKLSRPWHGPYRIINRSDPDVTVVKIYAPQDGQIQVHQSRVTLCPPGFPAGFFWYGNRRTSPGRPPKWVDKLLQGVATSTASDLQDTDFEVFSAHGAGDCAREQQELDRHPREVAGQDVLAPGQTFTSEETQRAEIGDSTQPDQIPTSDQSPTGIETRSADSLRKDVLWQPAGIKKKYQGKRQTRDRTLRNDTTEPSTSRYGLRAKTTPPARFMHMKTRPEDVPSGGRK